MLMLISMTNFGIQANSVDPYQTALKRSIPGRIAQSVMCLAADTCLIADPGVPSLIPERSHTFRGD